MRGYFTTSNNWNRFFAYFTSKNSYHPIKQGLSLFLGVKNWGYSKQNFRVTENILLFIAAAKAATTWNDFIERIRKEGFTPMPGLVAQARRHRRKRLILPSVSALRRESFIKKCVGRTGNAPKSEARRESAQTEGRAHEPQGGEVTARGRDRRLRHARRRRRHVRGVTESLPYVRHTNVVTSRRAVGAVEKHKSEICPKVNASFLPRKE